MSMENNKNYMHEWESHFMLNRQFLLSFTFRMTGSLSEAEDIVQDTFIACAKVNPAEIQNHKSWLTKVCSNRSLDLLKSASKRKETYSGVWLPDAIPDTFSIDKDLLDKESLTTSFLLLIQKLNSEERVVYVLNEIFEYTFKEIAFFIEKTEEACRKIAQRARKAMESFGRFNSYSEDAEKIVARFFAVAKQGSAEELKDLLAEDSEFWADGGGKVSVASKEVIIDRERIAKFFAALWSSKIFNVETVRQEIKFVNGRPGLVVSRLNEIDGWTFDTIISTEIVNGKIARLYVQRNPDKLNALLMKIKD